MSCWNGAGLAEAAARAPAAAARMHRAGQGRVASEAREDRARCDAKSEAARQNLQLASDRIREALGLSVENLLEEFKIDGEDLPNADSLEVKVGQIKRQREALGSVNLRAEEDASEVEEEHEKQIKMVGFVVFCQFVAISVPRPTQDMPRDAQDKPRGAQVES